jgi:hypothetical protein
MKKKINEIGSQYGCLQVLSFAFIDDSRCACWNCICCFCGRTKIVRGVRLRNSSINSCRCVRKGVDSPTYKHGHCTNGIISREWFTWKQMRNRCDNPNSKLYHRYGGRGITVCERWKGRDGFAKFFQDMGVKPEGLTLERINNDGNYEPSNCRWATRVEQTLNRITNILLEHSGTKQCISAWARQLNIPYTSFRYKLQKQGKTLADIIEESRIINRG